MPLSELIHLVLGFLFANHRFTLTCLEASKDPFMVMFHLFFLLMLLIKLKLNEFKLLLIYSLVFDCLALKGLILFFQLTDDLF